LKLKRTYILNNLDYNYQVVRVSDDFDYTIIFCENGKHFSVAKNNIMTLKPNVFIDLRESIIGNDEIGLLYKFNQICFYNTPSNKVSITTKLHYVFFDLETIVDWDYANCMKPYSLSICCLDEIQLEQLENMIEQMIKKRVKVCVSDLLKLGLDMIVLRTSYFG